MSDVAPIAGALRGRLAAVGCGGLAPIGDRIGSQPRPPEPGLIRNATVYFNNSGGTVRSGVMRGRIIRAKGFVTAVANRETCYSACALAWLAGKKRFIGYSAAVGFHAPHGKKWERIPAAEAIVAAYVRHLGFSDATATYVLAANPKDLSFMTNEFDGNGHGIALTWIPIPTYTPLP